MILFDILLLNSHEALAFCEICCSIWLWWDYIMMRESATALASPIELKVNDFGVFLA